MFKVIINDRFYLVNNVKDINGGDIVSITNSVDYTAAVSELYEHSKTIYSKLIYLEYNKFYLKSYLSNIRDKVFDYYI